MIFLDERGKQCPLPVIEAKKALERAQAGEYVQVMVDNEIAVQNLKKLAEQRGIHFEQMKLAADNYMVNLLKPGSNPGGRVLGGPGLSDLASEGGMPLPGLPDAGQPAVREEAVDGIRRGAWVVFSSDQMGQPERELGQILIKGFIFALTQQDLLPEGIIMYNGGVRLSTTEGDILNDLKTLEAAGVEIISCGTCLKQLGLEKELKVGQVSNMYEIVEKMSMATRLLKPC